MGRRGKKSILSVLPLDAAATSSDGADAHQVNSTRHDEKAHPRRELRRQRTKVSALTDGLSTVQLKKASRLSRSRQACGENRNQGLKATVAEDCCDAAPLPPEDAIPKENDYDVGVQGDSKRKLKVNDTHGVKAQRKKKLDGMRGGSKEEKTVAMRDESKRKRKAPDGQSIVERKKATRFSRTELVPRELRNRGSNVTMTGDIGDAAPLPTDDVTPNGSDADGGKQSAKVDDGTVDKPQRKKKGDVLYAASKQKEKVDAKHVELKRKRKSDTLLDNSKRKKKDVDSREDAKGSNEVDAIEDELNRSKKVDVVKGKVLLEKNVEGNQDNSQGKKVGNKRGESKRDNKVDDVQENSQVMNKVDVMQDSSQIEAVQARKEDFGLGEDSKRETKTKREMAEHQSQGMNTVATEDTDDAPSLPPDDVLSHEHDADVDFHTIDDIGVDPKRKEKRDYMRQKHDAGHSESKQTKKVDSLGKNSLRIEKDKAARKDLKRIEIGDDAEGTLQRSKMEYSFRNKKAKAVRDNSLQKKKDAGMLEDLQQSRKVDGGQDNSELVKKVDAVQTGKTDEYDVRRTKTEMEMEMSGKRVKRPRRTSIDEQSTRKRQKLSHTFAASPVTPAGKAAKMPRNDVRSMTSPSTHVDVPGFSDLRKKSSLAATPETHVSKCTSLLSASASPFFAEGATTVDPMENERVAVEDDAMSECSAKPEDKVRAQVSEAAARARGRKRGAPVVFTASARMSKMQARPKRKDRPRAPSFRDYLPKAKAGRPPRHL